MNAIHTENPIPPDVRDVIAEACCIAERYEDTQRPDVESAVRETGDALQELWFRNESDPLDNNKWEPSLGDDSLTRVLTLVSAAKHRLETFKSAEKEVEALRINAIRASERLFAVAASPHEKLTKADRRLLRTWGIKRFTPIKMSHRNN